MAEQVACLPPPGAVAAELALLPARQTLLTAGTCRVVWARPEQIPTGLYEIGCLRGGVARAGPLVLDALDEQAIHLVVWDQHRREIAGACRVGAMSAVAAGAGFRRTVVRTDPGAAGPAAGAGAERGAARRADEALRLLEKGIERYQRGGDDAPRGLAGVLSRLIRPRPRRGFRRRVAAA